MGNGVVGLVFRTLQEGGIPPPLNYAIGLAAFQLFFVPTGVMYWLASRTSPRDIETVRQRLRARARAATAEGAEPPQSAGGDNATDSAARPSRRRPAP